MTVSANVAAFIAERRDLLLRLEKFVETPAYERLLAIAAAMADDDPEPWLSEWLLEPTVGLDGLPIDVVIRPGGLERLEQHLKWIATFVVS